MSAVLVLLALLSLATLTSRRGGTAAFVTIATAPLLLGVGLLISPHGLGFVLPSLLHGVVGPLHVAVAWLALLVGLRGQRRAGRTWRLDTVWLVLWTGLAWVMAAGVAYGVLFALHQSDLLVGPLAGAWDHARTWALLMGALVAGTGSQATAVLVTSLPENAIRRRLLFVARHDDVLGALALLVPPVLLGAGTDNSSAMDFLAWRPAALAACSGVLLAMCALLMGAKRDGGSLEARMALVALVVVTGGMCCTAGMPEAPSAFLMGSALALAGLGGLLGEEATQTYDRPVRLAVLLLAGTLLEISVAALVLGAALCAGRTLGKWLVAWMASRQHTQRISVSVVLASSGLSVPLALSLLLMGPGDDVTRVMFTAVAVCVGITDLLTFAWSFSSWVAETKGRSITWPALPKQQGEHP